jgi:hypothetical protein
MSSNNITHKILKKIYRYFVIKKRKLGEKGIFGEVTHCCCCCHVKCLQGAVCSEQQAALHSTTTAAALAGPSHMD